MIRRAPRSTLFPATTRLRSVIEDNGSDGAITGPVNLGSTVHDKATVTGTPAAFAPTGTLTYNFYDRDTTTLNSSLTLTSSAGFCSTHESTLSCGSCRFQALY